MVLEKDKHQPDQNQIDSSNHRKECRTFQVPATLSYLEIRHMKTPVLIRKRYMLTLIPNDTSPVSWDWNHDKASPKLDRNFFTTPNLYKCEVDQKRRETLYIE